MSYYRIDTTPEQIDYTCAELERRAAYVNTTDLAQTMARDAVNMIRSLQAELQRVNRCVLDVRSMRTDAHAPYDARRWPFPLLPA